MSQIIFSNNISRPHETCLGRIFDVFSIIVELFVCVTDYLVYSQRPGVFVTESGLHGDEYIGESSKTGATFINESWLPSVHIHQRESRLPGEFAYQEIPRCIHRKEVLWDTREPFYTALKSVAVNLYRDNHSQKGLSASLFSNEQINVWGRVRIKLILMDSPGGNHNR